MDEGAVWFYEFFGDLVVFYADNLNYTVNVSLASLVRPAQISAVSGNLAFLGV